MQEKFLAIDIGASSGRHIVGWMDGGRIHTEEVYRFPNCVQRVDGHLEWDIDGMFAHVKQGIRAAFARYPQIKSLSIDTYIKNLRKKLGLDRIVTVKGVGYKYEEHP